MGKKKHERKTNKKTEVTHRKRLVVIIEGGEERGNRRRTGKSREGEKREVAKGVEFSENNKAREGNGSEEEKNVKGTGGGGVTKHGGKVRIRSRDHKHYSGASRTDIETSRVEDRIPISTIFEAGSKNSNINQQFIVRVL